MTKVKSNYRSVVINEVAILMQICLFFFAMVLGVISLFEKEFMSISCLILSLGMFFMAYNNHKVYLKKYATIIYFILGVGSLLIALNLLNNG
ncbi:MAG: hypothetical protein PHD10_01275 [Bacilli bacterium]|nr:hypothetical protein [Bacilli bacterium]MDD4607753.1 hypothetical protein [Bacilli bacterium]